MGLPEAEGRLHRSGVVMLAPHLTPENAAELQHAPWPKVTASRPSSSR